MKANKLNFIALSLFVFLGTSLQAQLLFTPDGGTYQNSNGQSNVGIGTSEPQGKLDIRDSGNSPADATLQIFNTQTNVQGQGPGPHYGEPRYAVLVKRQTALTGAGGGQDPGGQIQEVFSVQSTGKTAVGMFQDPADEMLAVTGSMGIHLSNHNIKLKYGVASKPELSWRTANNSNFYFRNENNTTTPLVLSPDGKVGINTEHFVGDHNLYIEGSMIMEEGFVKIKAQWPDYVFAPNYALMPLAEVGIYIEDHGRLPGMPSAAQVAEEGVALGETQRLLTEKVEELTLYLLEISSQLQAVTDRNEALNSEVETLRNEITTLRGEK